MSGPVIKVALLGRGNVGAEVALGLEYRLQVSGRCLQGRRPGDARLVAVLITLLRVTRPLWRWQLVR